MALPLTASVPASRCALWLWYRGDAFRGYQAQPLGPTVQQTVAQALRGLGVPRQPAPSGRTDLGVHARMQVASLRLDAPHTPQALVRALNAEAPDRLGCVVAREAPRSFHAQWSALGKEYRYRLSLDGPVPEAWAAYAWHPGAHSRLEGLRIHAEDLATVLQQAVGERDFGAFHESSSPRRLRTLRSAELCPIQGTPGLQEVRLVGSGFGRYQVRYLVGTALAVAAGILDESMWRAALHHAAPLPGLKAEARGLVLWEVLYPPELDPFGPTLRAAQELSLPFWARSSGAARALSTP